MTKTEITVTVNMEDLTEKLNLLIDICKGSPKLIKKFEGVFPSLNKLFTVKSETTPGAGCTVFLKPSPALLEFLSTFGTSNVE